MARALVIGINYEGTRCELKGCINDALNAKAMLLAKGYLESEITLMTDHTDVKPTRKNITEAMLALVKSKADRLYLHYAGHGCQVRDLDGDEEDGLDECIMPLDYRTSGCIIDDELKDIVLQLRSHQKLLAVFDCCHSGTVLDLRYNLYNKVAGRGLAMVQNRRVPATKGQCIMISGCQDHQTSADAYLEGKSQGAMTHSFLKCLPKAKNYGDLILKMQDFLKTKGYAQIPNLSAGKKFELSQSIEL